MLWDGEKKSIYAQYRQDFHRYIENKNSLSILFKTAFILIWAGLFGYLHKVFSWHFFKEEICYKGTVMILWITERNLEWVLSKLLNLFSPKAVASSKLYIILNWTWYFIANL